MPLSNCHSNQFYTLIPHAFGMKRPPLIDSTDMLAKKLSLLSSLATMEVAVKMLAKGGSVEHPIKANYNSLRW